MPKIEVYEDTLYRYMGKKVEGDDFITLLSSAKAELDGKDDDILKIELNDTNRPDLWSTAGLGRQLRVYLGGERPSYPFFSREGDVKTVKEELLKLILILKYKTLYCCICHSRKRY